MTMPSTDPAAGPAIEAAWRAARLIPPLWPLASSVAVNPFLGHTGEPLPTASARLARAAGERCVMPRAWHAARLEAGETTEADLAAASEAAPAAFAITARELAEAARRPRPQPRALPLVCDLVAEASGTDWPGIVAERLSHWAASHFDQGQALWAASRGAESYAAWREAAMNDLTPEIHGLAGFSSLLASLPQTADGAIALAAERLGLPEAAMDSVFHRLLTTTGGWAQLARHRLWQAELAGTTDGAPVDLLAIRLVWEMALLAHAPGVAPAWREAMAAHAEPLAPSRDDLIDALLQEAAERAAQRRLAGMIGGGPVPPETGRPALQMAFCIDVRSEVFRRALESLDPGIVTLGFAGFFGLGVAHRRFGSDVEELRLPVLLNPQIRTCSAVPEPGSPPPDEAVRLSARTRRAWGRFKLAAVSSFAFVEAAGPVYAGKLLRDGLGLGGAAAEPEPAPQLDPAVDIGARIQMAAGVLRAMSLTEGFARLVLLAGHGANVVNNPHASALHCGACGGYSGEVNARLLAALLNEAPVRAGLAERGIAIPADTLFIGALHDTTTDAVTLYDADHPSSVHRRDLAEARRWLALAGELARSERALRLPRAGAGGDIARRARDWAEVRPEWALAGCEAFIAAPRARTASIDLGGRAFLHDYDWRRDDGFGILELIMTAPVVVASWISLQYYGSSVAPGLFGAGNKLLHNVTGGIGVVEGNGGLLRTGLPWQSVQDGGELVHKPLRLSVMVEAPRAAITDILARHDGVRALFDHRWLHLFALDERGQMAWRYAGDLTWTPERQVEDAETRLSAAA